MKQAGEYLCNKELRSVADLVNRYRKSDTIIMGIGGKMTTWMHHFLTVPHDAVDQDVLTLMAALHNTSVVKKSGTRLADIPPHTDNPVYGVLAMHTFLLDVYLDQHAHSKNVPHQPPLSEVQAAAHIVEWHFRSQTIKELLNVVSGCFTPSYYVARLYGWDADCAQLQQLRRQIDGTQPEDLQQKQRLQENIWQIVNGMEKHAEQILEGAKDISLPHTYVDKLDAELQVLGWFARFPDKIDDRHANGQLLDKYGIQPGRPRSEQLRQIENAFRHLDARLTRMTGRKPYADDLFSFLRKGEMPSTEKQKQISHAAQPTETLAARASRKIRR